MKNIIAGAYYTPKDAILITSKFDIAFVTPAKIKNNFINIIKIYFIQKCLTNISWISSFHFHYKDKLGQAHYCSISPR